MIFQWLHQINFSKTAVPVAEILPISSLLCESYRKKHWFPQSIPKMWSLIINRAPVPNCWQSLTISVKDTRYGPAVISYVLLFTNSTFIDKFSIKNSCDKSSISRHLQLLMDLNKRSPLCNIQSESKESHMLLELSNVQQTDISDMHVHCIPLEIPYLISPLWWVAWTTFIILVSGLLNPLMHNVEKYSNTL